MIRKVSTQNVMHQTVSPKFQLCPKRIKAEANSVGRFAPFLLMEILIDENTTIQDIYPFLVENFDDQMEVDHFGSLWLAEVCGWRKMVLQYTAQIL